MCANARAEMHKRAYVLTHIFPSIVQSEKSSASYSPQHRILVLASTMKYPLVLVALAFATATAANPASLEERQTTTIPSVVCLTGPIGGLGSAILSVFGVSVAACDTGDTCDPLNLPPILRLLLPVGVSRAYYTLVLY